MRSRRRKTIWYAGDLPGEEWRRLLRHGARYEVSNLGRVRSRSKCGTLKILNPCRERPPRQPHARVRLYRGQGYETSVRIFVSRLVLEAFTGKAPRNLEAAHLNGNPTDDRLENLAWKTRQENADDMQIHGTVERGSERYNAKTSEAEVKRMRRMKRRGLRPPEIASRFPHLRLDHIYQLLDSKRCWKHVVI